MDTSKRIEYLQDQIDILDKEQAKEQKKARQEIKMRFETSRKTLANEKRGLVKQRRQAQLQSFLRTAIAELYKALPDGDEANKSPSYYWPSSGEETLVDIPRFGRAYCYVELEPVHHNPWLKKEIMPRILLHISPEDHLQECRSTIAEGTGVSVRDLLDSINPEKPIVLGKIYRSLKGEAHGARRHI